MAVIDDLKMILQNAGVNCITDAKTYTEQESRFEDCLMYLNAIELRERRDENGESFSDHLVSLGYWKGYNKAIEEFAKALKERCKRNFMAFDYQSVSVWEINRIAEELKKKSNETQTEVKGE